MRKINIIILLVLCLTLLLLTGCVVNTIIPETTIGNLGNQENTEEPVIENTEEPVIENTEEPVIENTEEPVIENTEEPVMWSGLGIGLYSTDNTATFDGYIDTLLANGFTEIRIDIPDYQNTAIVARSKAAVIRAIAKGANVMWGVSSNPNNNPDYEITAANWEAFRTGIKEAAQWSQDNGVFEFLLGNEEELHNDDDTMTDAQIRANFRSVATEVQAIYTNGNVSYACSAEKRANWISEGKGDMDMLGVTLYTGGSGSYDDYWKTRIDEVVAEFGSDGVYVKEFSVSWTSLDDFSEDEAIQAAKITEMIDYIKASGMKRAFYYNWKPEKYSPVKDNGTYRLLWDQALLNSGSVKSITVPTTTATISLPNTIALIQK